MNQKKLIAILLVIIAVLVIFMVYLLGIQKVIAPGQLQKLGLKNNKEIRNENSQLADSDKMTDYMVSDIDETANWKNTPAEIKNLTIKNNGTYLYLDMLALNPNFQPGVTDFFINQNTKLREVKVDDQAKFYKCGAGPDNEETTADVVSDANEFFTYSQKKLVEKDLPLIYYFDINDGVIQNIYEQCLP